MMNRCYYFWECPEFSRAASVSWLIILKPVFASVTIKSASWLISSYQCLPLQSPLSQQFKATFLCAETTTIVFKTRIVTFWLNCVGVYRWRKREYGRQERTMVWCSLCWMQIWGCTGCIRPERVSKCIHCGTAPTKSSSPIPRFCFVGFRGFFFSSSPHSQNDRDFARTTKSDANEHLQ